MKANHNKFLDTYLNKDVVVNLANWQNESKSQRTQQNYHYILRCSKSR